MSSATRLGIKLVFAGLVVATVIAFFVAQRLKRTLPIVRQVAVAPKYVSPNADRRNERVLISFRLGKPDNVTASIVDRNDEEVRRLITDIFLLRGRHEVRWNGRGADGLPVADGSYFLRVALRRQGRSGTNPTKIFVDVAPPQPVIASVAPNVLRLPRRGKLSASRRRVRIRLHGPTRFAPQFLAYRTVNRRAQLVARFKGRRRSPVSYWNGLAGGKAAPAGKYIIAVRVRDMAGNFGSGPPQLPPRPGHVRGHPELVVTHVAVHRKRSKR